MSDRLTAFEAVTKSYWFSFSQYGRLLRFSLLMFWLAFLIGFALEYAYDVLIPPYIVDPIADALFWVVGHDSFIAILEPLLRLVVLAVFSVTVFRMILLGERAPRTPLFFRFGRTERQYFLVLLAVWAFISAISVFTVVMMGIEEPSQIVGMDLLSLAVLAIVVVFICWFLLATLLIGPALVVSGRLEIFKSVRMVRGNYVHCAAVACATILLPYTIIFGASDIVQIFEESALTTSPAYDFTFMFLMELISLMVMVWVYGLATAAVSYAYVMTTGYRVPHDAETALEEPEPSEA